MQPTIKEILQGVPQAARTLGSMAGVNGIGNSIRSALSDYGQLFEKDRPLAQDYKLLKGKINKHIPPNAAFRDPKAMGEWSLAAALNAPMGLATKLPRTKFSDAHDIAQRNAALPIKQGGLGLHPDNTAMDRAKAMGFDIETPLYHGTNADISEFDLNKSGSATGAIQYGDGVYTTTNPGLASGYANPSKEGANVLPLYSNAKNLMGSDSSKKLTKAQVKQFIKMSPDIDNSLSNYGDVDYEGFNKVLNEAVNSNYEYQNGGIQSLYPIANDFYSGDPVAFNKAAHKITKHDGVDHKFSNGERFVIPWDAKNVRSRFAAFDPMKKDSANILASILGGTALASQYNRDKKKK